MGLRHPKICLTYAWLVCLHVSTLQTCQKRAMYMQRDPQKRPTSSSDYCVTRLSACFNACNLLRECVYVVFFVAHVAVCVLRCVAVCCGVLRCVAVCCGVLWCVAVWCSVLRSVATCYIWMYIAVFWMSHFLQSFSKWSYGNTRQNTATHCNTLDKRLLEPNIPYTATYCNTWCNTLD